jgi:hypothetical protein
MLTKPSTLIAAACVLASASAAEHCCGTCNATAGLEKYFSVAINLMEWKEQSIRIEIDMNATRK